MYGLASPESVVRELRLRLQWLLTCILVISSLTFLCCTPKDYSKLYTYALTCTHTHTHTHTPQMLVLNQNMYLLNNSLEDVQEMRAKVASVGSIIDSYGADFKHYQRQIGDITQSNTEIRNSVIAANDRVESFGVSIDKKVSIVYVILYVTTFSMHVYQRVVQQKVHTCILLQSDITASNVF